MGNRLFLRHQIVTDKESQKKKKEKFTLTITREGRQIQSRANGNNE